MGFDYRTSTGLGKQTLRGHKQNLVHQDPGERSTDPNKRWPRLACECPGVSAGGVDQWWPAAGLGSVCMGPFEEGCHNLHYLPHSLVSGQATGREHSPAHQQKIGLKIY